MIISSLNIVRVIKSKIIIRAGHVARMEEDRIASKILISTPTEKTSLGSCRRIWEDNIRMDLKEMGINTRN